ncbi:unnamed protein product [Allacma fusca]|uniref:Uncharacterized protein n=1 Tax=Allacma fusca TaxID=39272 RepID=A0A8J2JMG5_9HEXA|nr:unnamed protein product [Allacma fusca]
MEKTCLLSRKVKRAESLANGVAFAVCQPEILRLTWSQREREEHPESPHLENLSKIPDTASLIVPPPPSRRTENEEKSFLSSCICPRLETREDVRGNLLHIIFPPFFLKNGFPTQEHRKTQSTAGTEIFQSTTPTPPRARSVSSE